MRTCSCARTTSVGVVINGVVEEIEGLEVSSWFDDSQLHLAPEDFCRRPTKWVRNIVLHTTKGIPSIPGHPGWENAPQSLHDGLAAPNDNEMRVLKNWSMDRKPGGAHLVVGDDGHVLCLADLAAEEAYHATAINPVSIGIEIFQSGDGSLYSGQLDVAVKLVDWLTARLGVQRQVPWPYRPWKPPARLHNGADFVGVLGHRDQTGWVVDQQTRGRGKHRPLRRHRRPRRCHRRDS